MSNAIERLTGNGKVMMGTTSVGDARYDIRIYQEYEEVQLLEGPKTRTPTMRSVQLTLSPAPVAGFGERLTLLLSDGRKLDFFLTSSAGECTATGGLY